MAWLRLYAGEEDAYEVTLRFIQNHILMNTDKIPVEAGVQRFKDLNKLLEYCPSRKHLPDAPEALPEPRKLTEFELCTTVLASQHKHVLEQYNSAHGTTFTCELDQLLRLLKRSAEAVVTNRNLLNQYKQIASGSGHLPRDGKIPRKKPRFMEKKQEPGEIWDTKRRSAPTARSGNRTTKTHTTPMSVISITSTGPPNPAAVAASVGARTATRSTTTLFSGEKS